MSSGITPDMQRAISPSVTNGPVRVAAIPRYALMLAEMVETKAIWVVLVPRGRREFGGDTLDRAHAPRSGALVVPTRHVRTQGGACGCTRRRTVSISRQGTLFGCAQSARSRSAKACVALRLASRRSFVPRDFFLLPSGGLDQIGHRVHQKLPSFAASQEQTKL